MTPEQNEVSVPSLLATLAHDKHQIQERPSDEDVAEAAQAWQLTPTEAFLEGKAAGLSQAQGEVREKAGWPVEEESH